MYIYIYIYIYKYMYIYTYIIYIYIYITSILICLDLCPVCFLSPYSFSIFIMFVALVLVVSSAFLGSLNAKKIYPQISGPKYSSCHRAIMVITERVCCI